MLVNLDKYDLIKYSVVNSSYVCTSSAAVILRTRYWQGRWFAVICTDPNLLDLSLPTRPPLCLLSFVTWVVMVGMAGEASPEQEERGLQLQRPRLELQVVRVEIETAIGPLDKFHGHWKVG